MLPVSIWAHLDQLCFIVTVKATAATVGVVIEQTLDSSFTSWVIVVVIKPKGSSSLDSSYKDYRREEVLKEVSNEGSLGMLLMEEKNIRFHNKGILLRSILVLEEHDVKELFDAYVKGFCADHDDENAEISFWMVVKPFLLPPFFDYA